MSILLNHKKKWWGKDVDERHSHLFRSLEELDQALDTRRSRNKEHLARYMNKRYAGLRPGESSVLQDLYDDMTLNISKAAVSTVAAKICMHHPRPLILTQNGKYEEQERARGLQKFVQGVFSQNDIFHTHTPRAFIDCAVFDIGALKVYSSNGKIKIERVLPDEIIVDEEAALTSKPRELFQTKYITKERLIADFPKFKQAIMDANTMPAANAANYTDLVRVVESWHLPSGPKAKDGKHIIAIDSETLLFEDWNHEWFPFVFLRWDERPVGFYGQGLVEQLAPIQDEITKISQRIQESMHLLAVSWVILDKSSGIKKAQLKNVPAIILEKQGGPDPKVQTNAGVDPQVFQYLDYLYQKGFELAGVSQLSATSRKPAGIESGVALRTLLDTETQRFGLLARAWENLHVELARLVIRTANLMHDSGERLEVSYQDREWIEKIDFSSVQMEEDRFTLEIYPTNMLPQTPAGKLAFIQEMMGLGVIGAEQAAMLLELPDSEKWLSLETATLRSAHQIAEFILSGDDNWIEPEEFMDLELCAKVCQKHWVQGHINKIPKRRLDRLAEWINQAYDLISQPTPESPPDNGPGPGAGAPLAPVPTGPQPVNVDIQNNLPPVPMAA